MKSVKKTLYCIPSLSPQRFRMIPCRYRGFIDMTNYLGLRYIPLLGQNCGKKVFLLDLNF